jgi:hypothetical protein
LVELIETNVDLLEEFENFEGTFENDEIMEFKNLNNYFLQLTNFHFRK